MRVILAGATGAIGRPLTTALIRAGHDVIGITRNAAAAEQNNGLWSGAIVADVADADALCAAAGRIRCDAVINQVTAMSKPPVRYRDLEASDRIRIEGTRSLLSLARRTRATRFITQSFLGGYGYLDHRPMLRRRGLERIDERYPFDGPVGGPGLEATVGAVREAERLTLTQPGLEGITLRYGLFYGAGGPLEAMLARLRKRQLPLPRDGGGIHSYIWLPDAAAATVAALEQGVGGEAYNVCDDQPVRWNTFIDATAQMFTTPRPIRVPSWTFKATPYLRDLINSVIPMSNLKARRDLGWQPTAPTYLDGLARDAANPARHPLRYTRTGKASGGRTPPTVCDTGDNAG